MVLFLLLSLYVLSAAAQDPEYYEQSVHVKGQLFCGDRPTLANETKVKLINSRWGFDDIQNSPVDENGNFDITLTVIRYFWFTPKIQIFTDCDDYYWCKREIVISVSDKYVNEGVFDLGKFDLAARYGWESRSCWN